MDKPLTNGGICFENIDFPQHKQITNHLWTLMCIYIWHYTLNYRVEYIVHGCVLTFWFVPSVLCPVDIAG